MARHYTSRPQVVTNLPEYLKVAVVDKSYNTGIPITTAVRKLLALWVEGFIDLSPTAKVQINDYKPKTTGVPAPVTQFYEPLTMTDKAPIKQSLEGISDNRNISKEIVERIDTRLGAAREADGRIREYKSGPSERMVIRKRPASNKNGQLDSVSRSGGESDSHGGSATQEGSGAEEGQGVSAQGPTLLPQSRFK